MVERQDLRDLSDHYGASIVRLRILRRGSARSVRMTVLIIVLFACVAVRAGNETPAVTSTKIDVRSEDLLNQPPAAN